CRRFVS
ncbi:M6 family metalloprotease domain protein, partial [Vibrio parahaemolyticus EKP-028]